jgi:hypothetical protein
MDCFLQGGGRGTQLRKNTRPPRFRNRLMTIQAKKTEKKNENELKKKMKREREDDKKKRYRVQEKELKPWL